MKIIVSNSTCHDIASEIFKNLFGDYTVKDVISAISENYKMKDLIATPDNICIDYIEEIVKTALTNKLYAINVKELVL